jgi:hypothetical protein
MFSIMHHGLSANRLAVIFTAGGLILIVSSCRTKNRLTQFEQTANFDDASSKSMASASAEWSASLRRP